MYKDDRVRLHHMLDAAKEIQFFALGYARKDLEQDRKLALAIIKDIEIIGEAASQVSEELRARYPEIPWPSIVGMRNRLIHAYFDIDLDLVWGTVAEDLPPLIVSLEKIISTEG